MENNNQNKIYIKKDEEIPSIISRIKRHKEKEIILVVPYDSLILNNVLNLKILKSESEDLNKNISVITDSGHDKVEGKNVKMKHDDIKQEKRNSVSSIMKADDFSKFEKCAEIDVFSKKTDKLNEHASFKNTANSDLLDIGISTKTSREKKIKMFDIVKKVDSLNEVGKKKYKPAEEKIKNKKADSYQEDFKENNGNIEFQTEEKSINLAKKVNKKTTIIPALSSKIVALFIFISFVAVSLAVAFVLPKADINVVLKKEIATYDFEFIASESLDRIDAINSKIPLEKIEITSEKSENYPTTGKKQVQEKASGEIMVFNEYSSSPQRIVASTRFLSKESGKLFRIKDAVTIPGFSRVEGVDVPGQIAIKVYADKIGEEYNIGSDSFHLPGLQGSAKYAAIYARSTKAMSGGIDKEAVYFSQSDYVTAKENLVKIVEDESEKSFLNKISENDLFLEDTKKEEKLEINTDIEVGNIADNFQMSVKADIRAFSISKADLDEIINEKINLRLDTNKKLLDNSRSYKVGEIKIDEDEKITVPIHINQGLIIKVDIEKLKKDVADKSEVELKSYFSNMNGVKSTNISFWPFWVKSIPSSYEKINIAIDINDSL
ncbi:MAG: hypothetical protein KAS78_06020 [Candidatus Pacebacteria bacterium]|nr:hypothetical protein [Candidatus Paceibacterota bacterium]